MGVINQLITGGPHIVTTVKIAAFQFAAWLSWIIATWQRRQHQWQLVRAAISKWPNISDWSIAKKKLSPSLHIYIYIHTYINNQVYRYTHHICTFFGSRIHSHTPSALAPRNSFGDEVQIDGLRLAALSHKPGEDWDDIVLKDMRNLFKQKFGDLIT